VKTTLSWRKGKAKSGTAETQAGREIEERKWRRK